jgi:hypothetical protein
VGFAVRADGDGRIPFVLRIGVTGHRELADPARLVPLVRAGLARLSATTGLRSTEVMLVVASPLAEGADRLVARQVLAAGGRLEVGLPLPAAEYERDFASEASRADFRDLLGRASSVWCAPAASSREEAYELAGRFGWTTLDAMIALWDGEPARGRGGTADVVARFRQAGLLLCWVRTSGAPAISLEAAPGRLRSLRRAARWARRFNSPEVSGKEIASEMVRSRDETGWAGHGQYLARAAALVQRLRSRARLEIDGSFAAAATALALVIFARSLPWPARVALAIVPALASAVLAAQARRLLAQAASFRSLEVSLRFGASAASGTSIDLARPDDVTDDWVRRALLAISLATDPLSRTPQRRVGRSMAMVSFTLAERGADPVSLRTGRVAENREGLSPVLSSGLAVA